MKKWFFIGVLTLCAHLSATTALKERLAAAKAGDYVVTSQGNHYSMLLVKTISPKLILEEITIPSNAIDPNKTSWKEWVNKRAPGHTAWLSYTFDLEKNALIQCYSVTQQQLLFIDPSDYLLAKLLVLPLKPTPNAERKRIGPAPTNNEIDRRKLWLPPLIRAGQKLKDAHFEVVKTKWPDDGSRMAGCDVELYLDADRLQFPFPYWLEIQGAHYTFKMQTIDSGSLN